MTAEGTNDKAAGRDRYEQLRRMLERVRQQPVHYEEAQEFGVLLVDLYELLAADSQEIGV